MTSLSEGSGGLWGAMGGGREVPHQPLTSPRSSELSCPPVAQVAVPCWFWPPNDTSSGAGMCAVDDFASWSATVRWLWILMPPLLSLFHLVFLLGQGGPIEMTCSVTRSRARLVAAVGSAGQSFHEPPRPALHA